MDNDNIYRESSRVYIILQILWLKFKTEGKIWKIYSKFTKTPKIASAPTSEDSLRAQFRHLVALTSRAHNHLVTEKD